LLEILQKIEKSLDLRFEKENSLYISKDDEEKIKEAILKSQYQNVSAFSKRFGNRIIAKIFTKNSWLVSRVDEKSLTPLFKILNQNFLEDISKDIVEDRVFASSEFKSFLLRFGGGNCEKVYKDGSAKVENRATCFGRYLKEYLKSVSASHGIRFIEQELNKNHEIEKYLQAQNPTFLNNLFQSDLKTVAKWIIENRVADRKDKIWKKLLISLGESGFQEAVEYIDENPSWDNNTTKILIQRILKNFYKVPSFVDEISELYSNHWRLRILFIQMLEPDKFKDKDIAHNLLEEFEDMGIPEKAKNSAKIVLDWEKAQNGFSSVEKLLQELNSNHDFSNLGTLNFLSIQFQKTSPKILIELFENYGTSQEVKTALSYFIAKSFKNYKFFPRKVFQIVENSYSNEISRYLEELHICTKEAKIFFEKYGKHQAIAKCNRR
jgi:hypothetical protein